MCYHTSFRGKKWDEVRNLIMIGNLGQQRHAEWARKGGRFSYVLAIARETTAAALEKNIFVLNLN